MSIMYVSEGQIKQENERKIKMLALFNTLTEEDKDIVISMSDSLVRKHGSCVRNNSKSSRDTKRSFL